METLELILSKTLYPIQQIFFSNSQIYWLYLLSSLVIAVTIYIIQYFHKKQQKPFLEYCLPKEVFLHQSAILDYQNYLPIMLIKSFIIEPITTILSATVIAHIVIYCLTNLTGINSIFNFSESQTVYNNIAFSIFMIVIIDFGYYYNHYLRHKVPLLWEFHKIHHTAEVLTPFTLYRHHPLDYFVQVIAVSICSGIGLGVWTYLFGCQGETVSINGIPVLLFIFYLTGNFRHSHIWLAFPHWISHIFISPAQHYIHHANEIKYYDANYGKIFAFWDWIFGTLYVPRQYEKLELGLPLEEGKLFDSVFNFYWQPFKAVVSKVYNQKV